MKSNYSKLIDNSLMIDYLLGTSVSRYFGLDRTFFTKHHASKSSSLNNEIDTMEQSGMVFVKLPEKILQIIKEGYIAVKINTDDNEDYFDYILILTPHTRIGFWK